MTTNPTAPQDGGEKLAPCPHCLGTFFTWLGNEAGSLEWPHCSGCGMAGPAGEGRANAIGLWNSLPRTDLALFATLAEALHDRLFGIASLNDPDLALREIGDDGGIHGAAHELIRALPPRRAIRALQQKGPSNG